MARTAFGEGPRGFSFEASFTESEIPNSRSTSSIGLPGEYGIRPERYGEARSSRRRVKATPPCECADATCSRLPALGRRVRAQHLEEDAVLLQAGQRLAGARLAGMPLE